MRIYSPILCALTFPKGNGICSEEIENIFKTASRVLPWWCHPDLCNQVSVQGSKRLHILLHLSTVIQFLGVRHGNHKKQWPCANITSSSATSSEMNYSRLPTFSQRRDFHVRKEGQWMWGLLFLSWRIRGFCALQSVQTKNEREKRKKVMQQ